MTEKRYPVHYANFVCHFGNRELLDYLNEIVLPAFTSPDAVRTFKNGRYFFDSVELVNLAREPGTHELAICGRFVKDMIVRSEQRWDSEVGTLVAETRNLETAPSAVFVLLLASHKLIYLLETASAPGMESFRTTAANFLSVARRSYIDSIANRAKSGELTESEQAQYVERDEDGDPRQVTKSRLNELVGATELEIVPLSNEETLRSFLQLFQKLQVATVRLVKPNSELDNDDFIEGFRDQSDAVGSRNSTLSYRNPEGLIQEKVAEQLEIAAADANTEIKLAGVDATGRSLRGSNNEFKIVSYLEKKPPEIPTLAQRMFTMFRNLRKDGLIKTADANLSDQAAATLANLAAKVANDGHADAH